MAAPERARATRGGAREVGVGRAGTGTAGVGTAGIGRFGRAGRVVALVAVAAAGLAACGGSSSSASAGGGGTKGADSGASLTMWVRSQTDQFSKRLVDAYNKSHKNQVKLTIVPNDNYQQKVGAAAGSNTLPDLLASDVVYAPNYVKQGILRDITDAVKAAPGFASLAKAHLDAASKDGKYYAVPHRVDSSLIFYNKDLFTKAGLDPNSPPKTFDDIYNDAKKIRGLGGDTYGFYFGGNCPGCNAYTAFPYAVAAGHPPVSADGKKADIDNQAFAQAFALYKRMTDEGIAPASVKTEDGSTWTAPFLAGKIGVYPAGSFVFPDLITKAKFNWGVTPLMAPDGSKTATFVGGDLLGVSKSAKDPAAALDFLTYTLSDDAQVNIVAKNGDLTARTDLADNQYSAKDPRIAATIKGLANGYTPATLPYGELFNNANGPWNAAIRGAVFGGDPAKALKDAQSAIQSKIDSVG